MLLEDDNEVPRWKGEKFITIFRQSRVIELREAVRALPSWSPKAPRCH
jgi:hypothetical protein